MFLSIVSVIESGKAFTSKITSNSRLTWRIRLKARQALWLVALLPVVSQAVERENVIESLKSNLGQTNDLQFKIEVQSNYAPRDAKPFELGDGRRIQPFTEPRVTEHERAMRKTGQEYWAASPAFPLTSSEKPTERRFRSFDGNKVYELSLQVSEGDPKREGGIFSGEYVETLRNQASDQGLVEHVWQGRAGGKTLLQWLNDEPSTSNLGLKDVDGTPCVEFLVKNVYDEKGEWFAEYKYYLAPEFNYAIKRYDRTHNGELSQSIVVTEFEEISPGLWFPMVATNKLHGPNYEGWEGGGFVVTEVAVNEGILDEVFGPKFRPGDIVYDQSLNTEQALRFVWGGPAYENEYFRRKLIDGLLKESNVETSTSNETTPSLSTDVQNPDMIKKTEKTLVGRWPSVLLVFTALCVLLGFVAFRTVWKKTDSVR